LQLLSGTVQSAAQTNGAARVKGFLGADQTVAMRWMRTGGAGEVERKPVLAADTTVTAQVTPTLVKYVTQLRYEIIQGKPAKLLIALPANHALTRLTGEQIRDWELKPASGDGAPTNAGQVLEVKFIRPMEKKCEIVLYSEQSLESLPTTASLAAPQPLDAERESGALTVSTEDTVAEVDSLAGLRQINAAPGEFAAYRFNSRPFSLALRLKRIEPIISVAERVALRMEETRLVSTHSLQVNVEKAGIYGLELHPPAGLMVTEVHGDGVEDWKLNDSVLRINFSTRVLGARTLEVQLEQSLKSFPDQISAGPLRIAGATKEHSEIGASGAPGIRLKTGELSGLREVPVRTLQSRANASGIEEMLGYRSEQPDWKLTVATERLSARVVAEIFNLITIGDGIIGGSATIRYGLIGQGVQEFDVKLPESWKNVEFTGPNIRRKEQRGNGLWRIGLQDKAWDGYTLVVTYDFQFDPKSATLGFGGIHTVGVERETGSVAITTAASLKLTPVTTESLRRIDELELGSADRGLITRPVLLAYQYGQPEYKLEIEAKRYAEVGVLSAVADRTQLTSVLTDAGEMLTQASFMVKNNDKQFQRFKLPAGAKFWSCHVNGQPVKAEQDGDWLMAPLPRGANRDQAYTVDIVYAEQKGVKTGLRPHLFALAAPQTDVPNTYAEWQLFAPVAYRLSGFAGNMIPVRGTTYDLQDAWQKFTRFYWETLHEAGAGLLVGGALILMMVILIASAIRRGASGVISVLVIFAILAILAAMLLPALSKAKSRAQRINAMNNLKQIGLAVKTYALDNKDRMPNSWQDMMNELNTDKVTYDPETGQQFIYLGSGLDLEKIHPDSVICYSPTDHGGARGVLFADGHVEQVGNAKFEQLARRGWIIQANAQQIGQNQQLAAVRGAQLQAASIQPLPGAATANGQPIIAQAEGDANNAQPATGPRMRAIHIDIPKEGQAFVFTKVLNLGGEPLGIDVKIMRLRTFQALQMLLQVSAFIAGVLVCWRQWNRRRNTLVMTFGLALALCAVGSLLLAWRMLHLALIWLAPVLLLAVIAWLTWRFWPRPRPAPEQAPQTGFEPGLPPAVATIALLFTCLTATAETLVPGANVSVLSASYAGAIHEQVAEITAVLRVSTSKPEQKLKLFGDDVAVQEFSAKPVSARLVREGKEVSVLLPGSGEATLQLKLLVKLEGDVTRRQLAFGVPGALTSQLSLTIDQPDAEVEFPAAVSLKQATSKQQTHIDAVMGSGERVELLWTPRVKRAAEIAANVICHNASLVTLGGGVVNARTILDYQVTQGELRQIRIRIPAGHRLLRVEGEGIRTWQTKTEGEEQTLSVELLKGVAPAYRLAVETERTLDALPAMVKADVAHAIDVKRETGLVALRSEDDLELNVESTSELYRVDAEEFSRAFEKKDLGTINAFRFLKPDFSLATRVAAVQPRIEAVLKNNVWLGQEQIAIEARVDYIIRRAGVFALKLGVPEDYRIENVQGTNLLQWVEKREADQRVLEVTLKERTLGNYELLLMLALPVKPLPRNPEIVGVIPLNTEKLTGFISVGVEPGVAVKGSTFDGLTEVPAGGAAADNSSNVSVLAYKFMGSGLQPKPAWKLSVETESVESWVRAEIINTLTVTDDLIAGRAVARYEIQNAPVKELSLRIPAAFKNVEISGANIRRKDNDGEVWKIEFQSKVRSAQILTVTWEQPRAAGTNSLEPHGIGAANVERETGILAVVARPPLQITARDAGDLKPIDIRDLPEWAGQPNEATVLAYRYVRPGYKLGLEARRFAEAEVLQVLVEKMNLSTVVADDGQMMTQMSLAVHNQGRQYLEITLPLGATVWSAFVAGQAVRPSEKDGKLLLPLEHSTGEEAPIGVELVYVGSGKFPHNRGAMDLVSPRLDAPFKSAKWELFLPLDYEYNDFGGTMTHEVETAILEPSDFSLLEYSSRESKSKAELAKEVKSEIMSAQTKLSKGKVREALADYNRARNKADLAARNTDAKQLETELRRAQGGNLIQAQNAFISNNGTFAPNAQGAQGSAGNSQYDVAAAEAQWTKLQQAQELGVAPVQPIRVNLPTRGMRHGFAQLLQTDERGKPMTIHLIASNSRSAGWMRAIIGPLAGFLSLWLVVTFLVKYAPFKRPVAA
jgi:prepilin-type processing-associated H-X9-DG protein